MNKNKDKIKTEYPNISKEEAEIIASYTCNSEEENYNPYKILNTALVSEDRRTGILKVSKYLYILLCSLRKLKRYKFDSNYLYRGIDAKINVDISNKNIVPYIKGNTKTFWGFTSTSTDIKTAKKFLKQKKGTIFYLSGNI